MIGPGKYDASCEAIRLATGAEAVVLIVINGVNGSGISVKCEDGPLIDMLPGILRSIADAQENDLKNLRRGKN